jgi:aminoglycoside phosphotransferase (APT) family kinase protein
VHGMLPLGAFSASLSQWDYEAELLESSRTTLDVLEQMARQEDLRPARQRLPAVRRVVASIPLIRQQLAGDGRGAVVLHGDLHPGNTIIRRQGASPQAILLDWGRTRLGSALEDVCSWLQSLGYWEPEVRRYHDTLLRHYLAARGGSSHLSRSLRDLYWLAGACNGLAGALRYHLLVMADSVNRTTRVRRAAAHSVRDWLRVI